jgi:peptide/nickel transport system ATP-binding protein
MASLPSMYAHSSRLAEIPGLVPSPLEPRRGCAFAPRCRYANARCHSAVPNLTGNLGQHAVACFAAEEGRIPDYEGVET